MVYQKYIPLYHGNQYYIYDCLKQWLYPCSKTVFDFFLSHNSVDIESQKNVCQEVSDFMQMLSQISHHEQKFLLTYPKVSRDDVIDSLSCVPHIVLELTEKCNMACTYCCYGNLYKKVFKRKKERKESILLYLKTLIGLRNQYNIKSDLRLTFYGGEPLLRFDIIKECVELTNLLLPDVTVTFGMTTNGVLLHLYLDYLVEHDFFIVISIDGDRKNDEYRLMRNGKESFFLVVKNIEKIYQNYQEYFKNRVTFSTVLHHKSSYIDATKFFSRWNKIPLFSSISSSNAKKNSALYKKVCQQHRYSNDEIENYRKNFPDISESIFPTQNRKISAWSESAPEDVNGFYEIQNEEKYIYPGKSCFLFSSRVFITIDGKIYLCEKSSRKFLFGRITEKGFIIYQKQINGYYDDIVNLYNKICPLCYKSCSCSKCFFSDSEEIVTQECVCLKEQAIREINNIINTNK